MKKAIALVTPAAVFLTVTVPAFAVDACAGPYNHLCALSSNNIGSIVGTVIALIFAVAILVALLYLVWGGFKWLTSGGDKQAVASAREHIVAAIVGLVIIFLSYLVLNLILQFFGLNTLSNVVIPNINGSTAF